MPQVIFAQAHGEPLSVPAPDGGSLADLCDDVGAPVPFSCRGATCGTCRVIVLEGAELLFPPEADEEELLRFYEPIDPTGSPAGTQRLACQAKMRQIGGRIVLRPVGDPEAG